MFKAPVKAILVEVAVTGCTQFGADVQGTEHAKSKRRKTRALCKPFVKSQQTATTDEKRRTTSSNSNYNVVRTMLTLPTIRCPPMVQVSRVGTDVGPRAFLPAPRWRKRTTANRKLPEGSRNVEATPDQRT